jgi:hypothetical protein
LCHLLHLPAIKSLHLLWYYMSWLRICVVADFEFAGDSAESWKQKILIHFGCWKHGMTADLCQTTGIQQSGGGAKWNPNEGESGD